MAAWRDMDHWVDRAEAYQQHVNLDAEGFYPDLKLADLDALTIDELFDAIDNALARAGDALAALTEYLDAA